MKAYIELYDPLTMREEVVNLELRESDVEELRAASGQTPKEVLTESLAVSDITFVIRYQDKILGVFGVTPHKQLEDAGIPWLLMSKDVIKHIKYQFIAGCQPVIRMFHNKYPLLINMIDARQKKYLRWLQWLGFTICTKEKQFLHDKSVPFYIFYKKEHPLCVTPQ